MCRYGLRVPGDKRLIRKATQLLIAGDGMLDLAKECPGEKHAHHQCHLPVAGTHPSVGQVSTFAGQYTPAFVQAVLRTLHSYRQASESLQVPCDAIPSQAIQEVMMVKADLNQGTEADIKKVIDRVHRNLGHPPTEDLVRVLKHAHASEQAISLARQHSCDLCKAQQRPHVPLPSKASRPSGFNQVIGIDVKYLQGWRPNQKVKALNIVCHGSCYQLMIPFFERETSELIQRLLAMHWIRVFGPPQEVVMDSAQTNLGEPLQRYLEHLGVYVRPIPGEAHWQLGRTETHGGWFSRVLEKTMQSRVPSTREEWEQCVLQSHVKNSMIQFYGYTPHQYVFGKNPNIPQDLLDEPIGVVPATASLSDDAVATAQAIRFAARKAVLETQDDQALRRALAARPRKHIQFEPGALVAYWRAQKYTPEGVIQGGRWWGTAVVLGSVGKNYLVVHRKQIFRVAPEQLRPATNEEQALVKTPQAELLGIRDLIEGGTFRSSQYIDLVPGSYPAQSDAEHVTGVPESDQVQDSPMPAVKSAEQTEGHDEVSEDPTLIDKSPMTPEHAKVHEDPTDVIMQQPSSASGSSSSSGFKANQESQAEPTSYQYGPIRHRVEGKSHGAALYRPSAMKHEDFVDMMREVVPRLLDAAPTGEHKRSPSEAELSTESQPPAQKARPEPSSEVLSVQDVGELMVSWDDPTVEIEIMIAQYMEKKLSKEVHHSGHPPDVQKEVDASKTVEWQTLLEKGVVRIYYGKKAQKIKEEQADRFMGSRFVIIRKPSEENQHIDLSNPSTYKIKSRWCLQGHLDPDLDQKAQEGLLQSPTLSQMGRMLLMQLIASHQWTLQLGDIKGAFLEAGPLNPKYRPLYAKQPPGGIPGVPSDAVIEVLGNVYGQNDAPSAWHKTFHEEAIRIGWVRSKFDPCLYYLRDVDTQKLIGVMGVHVDDTCLGGTGEVFESAVKQLRARFPYRKWRISEGEFCGSYYTQNKQGEISMSQKLFAEKLRPAQIPKGAACEDPLSESQIRVLRAINGSLNWLASQSRPDLAAQTSLSQQAFPRPTIRHLRDVNNAVRRAKLNRDLQIRFKTISPDRLTICCHSDAAFANVGTHTQAGYILAFVDQDMNKGKLGPWTPAVWRSYRMSRAVSSTLAGESQAMATASGTVEWLSLLLCEALDGHFDPRQGRDLLAKRPPLYATDCKSLFDHLISPSSPTAVEDRRTSIDIVIIRESLLLTNGVIRWLPTDRMLADGLTKDRADPVDLLSSCVRAGSYQISPEAHVLEQQAAERELRRQKRQPEAKVPDELVTSIQTPEE